MSRSKKWVILVRKRSVWKSKWISSLLRLVPSSKFLVQVFLILSISWFSHLLLLSTVSDDVWNNNGESNDTGSYSIDNNCWFFQIFVGRSSILPTVLFMFYDSSQEKKKETIVSDSSGSSSVNSIGDLKSKPGFQKKSRMKPNLGICVYIIPTNITWMKPCKTLRMK